MPKQVKGEKPAEKAARVARERKEAKEKALASVKNDYCTSDREEAERLIKSGRPVKQQIVVDGVFTYFFEAVPQEEEQKPRGRKKAQEEQE